MPNVFSDPPFLLYTILVIGFVIAGAAWYRLRSRKSRIAVAVLAVLLGALILIDRLVESPREESVRRVEAMAAAATARDPARFVEQLAKSFAYNGKTRVDVRNSGIWNLIREYNARVAVWGMGKDDFQILSDTEIEFGFYAKGEAAGQPGAVLRYIRTRFVKEADGAYRMKAMKFYSIENGNRAEEPIAGFP